MPGFFSYPPPSGKFGNRLALTSIRASPGDFRITGADMNVHRFSMLVSSAFYIVATPLLAHAQSADVAKMVAEISQLSAEQKQEPGKVQQSLALKRQHEAQFKQLAQQGNSIKAASNAIEARRSSVYRLCHGKYPRSQLAAANARCNSVLVPFNRQVTEVNARRHRLAAAYQSLRQKEAARVAAAKRLQARDAQIRQRIAVLQASIRAHRVVAKPSSCSQACMSKSGEALSQCMQSCFDGARSDTSLPTVEQKYRPPSGATSNRTPEQAIEEYKKSGNANPLPKSFRREAPPPPPPSR